MTHNFISICRRLSSFSSSLFPAVTRRRPLCARHQMLPAFLYRPTQISANAKPTAFNSSRLSTATCESCVNGRCVGPDQCLCSGGFKGPQCTDGTVQSTEPLSSYSLPGLFHRTLVTHEVLSPVDSRCERVRFAGEAVFPALHEHARQLPLLLRARVRARRRRTHLRP